MIPSDLGLPVMNIRKCVTIKNEIKKSHSCPLDYMTVEFYEEKVSPHLELRHR